MCRRTAKQEIEAFKANIIINIQQLTKIITTVLWEINRDDFNTIDQMCCKEAQIVKQSMDIFTVLKKIASFSFSFDSVKLKLAHINIRSCRNKEVELSLFRKDNDIDIATINETWLKSKFKPDIPNYIITRKDKGEELLSLCVIILNSISSTRAPQQIPIMKPLLFSKNTRKIQLVFQQFISHQPPLLILRYSIALKTLRII